MVLSYDFYNSSGVLRWNLGWASPTYAGAFLSTIIPYAWALEKSAGGRTKLGRYSFLAFESVLVFLLCKTQSRGALVALVLAGAHWHLLLEKGGRWRPLFARMAVLVGCIWLAGFSTRIEPNYVSSDLSIAHRLTLWSGSFKVFGASPMCGCGAGSSGRLFRAWFQPLDWTQYYSDPVNSYLFAAIEFGVLISGLAIFVLILAVAAAPKKTGASNSAWHNLAIASGSSIVAWSTASMFSTLWDEYPLWIVPILSILLAAGYASYRKRILVPAVMALGLTIVLEGSAKAVAWELVRTETVVPRILGKGITRVSVTHHTRNSWPVCHIWLDREVLGTDPEKELRKWLSSKGSPPLTLVHDRLSDPKHDPADGDVVILVGRSAERLERSLTRRYSRIILVNPIAPYRDSLPLSANAVVVIPEIDQDGTLENLRASQAPGVVKIVAPGVGNDIRLAWPAVMEKIDGLYR